MKRLAAALAVLLALTAVPFIATASPAVAAGGCDTCEEPPPPSGPPPADYSGTIRIVKDGRPVTPGGAGEAGTSCPGCRWQLVVFCFYRNPNDPDDALCANAATYCEGRGGGTAFALYLARPPEYTWRQVDVVCLGPDDGVVPIGDIGPQVAEAFAAVDLPEVGITVQPPDGALVNVPALFSAPEPLPQTDSVSISLGGITLSLTITATVAGYTWDFGDGSARRPTGTAGAPYAPGTTVPPEGTGNPYVSHVYSRPGSPTVTLDTRWIGTFDDGGGVPRNVERIETTTAGLQVKTARSELVGGAR